MHRFSNTLVSMQYKGKEKTTCIGAYARESVEQSAILYTQS